MTDFSHPLTLTDLNNKPVTITLEANAEERAAIAARLKLPAVHAFTARLTVRRSGSRVRVTGEFEADAERVCVVSLEPFRTSIADTIDEEFFLSDEPEALEIDLDPDDVMAESLSGETLDLGELVIQNLSLALDPHPRADGAKLADLEYEERQFGEKAHPFSALAKLRQPR